MAPLPPWVKISGSTSSNSFETWKPQVNQLAGTTASAAGVPFPKGLVGSLAPIAYFCSLRIEGMSASTGKMASDVLRAWLTVHILEADNSLLLVYLCVIANEALSGKNCCICNVYKNMYTSRFPSGKLAISHFLF